MKREEDNQKFKKIEYSLSRDKIFPLCPLITLNYKEIYHGIFTFARKHIFLNGVLSVRKRGLRYHTKYKKRKTINNLIKDLFKRLTV